MGISRPVVVLIASIGLIVAALLIAPAILPSILSPAEVESSTYGYSVSLDTNATLQNLTLYLPLPISESGSSPVAAAVRQENVDAPDSWRYSVVETDRDLMVRIEAEQLPAELRDDGHRYSVYQFGLSVPADDVIDTGEPYGNEPVIAPMDGRRVRPCPNVAEPAPDQTCFDYNARIYVAYDAPPEADVGIRLVHNGVNSYEAPRHDIDMYYERVYVGLRGPQDGWIVVDGFASVEERS